MSYSRPLADWQRFPRFMLQITGRCNLACPQCYRLLEDWDMPLEAVLENAQRMGETGYSWADLGGGEPTMHPEIDCIVDALHQRGFKVSLTTNGVDRATIARLPLDGLTVSSSVPGWDEMAKVRPDLSVGVNVIVGRGDGETALEEAARAARCGFARAVFLPLLPPSGAPESIDCFPDTADLDLIVLASPWLEELGLEVAFGCAALRALGLLDECPDEFRAVDLHGNTSSCAFPACRHAEPAQSESGPAGPTLSR